MIRMFGQSFNDDWFNEIKKVMKSGVFTNGPNSKEFEEKFAEYVGSNYAISVNSGTSALHLSLLANGIGNGDEVITSPYSFIATVNAIRMTGAKPVFVDIKDDFNINETKIEEKIGPKTKAVLPVHLFGKPCNLNRISDICNENELALIQDSCQALGAKYDGTRIGGIGTNAFSFYPTKAINTMEGGMITTNSEEIYLTCQNLKNHGNGGFGFNYRMNEVSAKMGLLQLPYLDNWNNKRIENANKFNRIKHEGFIKPNLLPSETEIENIKHVYHQYTLRVMDYFHLTRDEVIEKLKKAGIESRVYYEKPLSKRINDRTEIAFRLSNEALSIPVHPNLTNEEIEKIIETLNGI